MVVVSLSACADEVCADTLSDQYHLYNLILVGGADDVLKLIHFACWIWLLKLEAT